MGFWNSWRLKAESIEWSNDNSFDIDNFPKIQLGQYIPQSLLMKSLFFFVLIAITKLLYLLQYV